MRLKFFDGAIPAAGTTTYTIDGAEADTIYLLSQAAFDYGSGGTTVKAFIQTSVDDGTTWVDIISHAFATTDATALSKVSTAGAMTANYTPTDGTLTDNTVKDGLLGDQLRLKLIVAGTYAATTLKLYGAAKTA
jgi:hypothetical protein